MEKVELVCFTNHINSHTKRIYNPQINEFIGINLKNIVTKISKAIKVFKYLVLLRIKYMLTIKQNENIWKAKRLKD